MKKKGVYMVAALMLAVCVFSVNSSGDTLYRGTSPTLHPTTVSRFDYVIITDEGMQDSVAEFKNWKESLGYSVKIETTTVISTTYEGRDLAEQIRNYLIDTYLEWNIHYVLIIGSRDTIPMRTCIPFSEYHENEFLRCPSDYYYADLTGEWDADNDDFFGEYQEDAMDFYPEVSVGRIPCDDSDEVNRILQRIISYELDTSEWKKNVLLPGAVIFYDSQNASGYTWERSDGATLMEECRLDIFEPHGYQCIRMYEAEGLRPSTYDYDIPLTRENVIAEWTNNYGIVDMLGHASNTKITRLVWDYDDGDNIPEYPGELQYTPFLNIADSDELTLETPPIVYTSGCAQLFSSRNMGRSFMEDGAAVAFIGTTQGSWYGESLKWDTENDGGTYSLNYYFFYNLIENKQSCGASLYNSKLFYYENFWYNGIDKNWIFRSYDNMYSLTLYGDPSLGLYERSSAPDKPGTPDGPPSGKIRTEYTYTTVSIDPDGDQVRYLFNWGDSTSSLSDYYSTGEEISMSHTWNKQGNFTIRVRCEDTHGSWSDWSDPLSVSMPKPKAITPLFETLVDRFPLLVRQLNLGI